MLQEIKCDIWKKHEEGFYIVIPTNGFVKNNGKAVMGRGLALQAQIKFPEMSSELGTALKEQGNEICLFYKYRLITLPVKRNWWERADLNLIKTKIKELRKILDYGHCGIITPIYIPKIGCGNGKLSWKDVKPILEKHLDENRFIICDNGQGKK